MVHHSDGDGVKVTSFLNFTTDGFPRIPDTFTELRKGKVCIERLLLHLAVAIQTHWFIDVRWSSKRKLWKISEFMDENGRNKQALRQSVWMHPIEPVCVARCLIRITVETSQPSTTTGGFFALAVNLGPQFIKTNDSVFGFQFCIFFSPSFRMNLWRFPFCDLNSKANVRTLPDGPLRICWVMGAGPLGKYVDVVVGGLRRDSIKKPTTYQTPAIWYDIIAHQHTGVHMSPLSIQTIPMTSTTKRKRLWIPSNINQIKVNPSYVICSMNAIFWMNVATWMASKSYEWNRFIFDSRSLWQFIAFE